MNSHHDKSTLAPLAARRLHLGLSQDDVARLTGLTQATLSRMERGVGDPRLSTIQETARALGMDLRLIPRELLPYVDDLLRSAAPGSSETGGEERPLYALTGDEDDEAVDVSD